MHKFQNPSAQGDVQFTKIDKLPSDLTEVPAENGNVIVTHSETGHHHVMDAGAVSLLERNEFERFLVVKEPTALKHLRPFDTHEPILFDEGVYRVRRQREYTPEGFRRVED